jgi:hypothetical protein
MQAEDVGGYKTDRLNQLPVVQQGGLVLNVIVGYPSLDLVTQPLELLNLRLEIRLQLLFLRLVRRVLHLFVDAFELLNTFGDPLQCPVDFRCGDVERGQWSRSETWT